MRRLPSLNAIRVFEAAARHENFTRAAAELGLTQTAVSHQIRSLEEQVVAPLFSRIKGRVALTDAGRRLVPQISAALDSIEEAFGALAKEDGKLLSISTTSTFATVWLAPRLGEFQIAHQEFGVRLSVDRNLVDFSTGEFHAAIRMGRGGWPGLRQHFLFRLHYAPMCSPEFAERHELRIPEQLLTVPRFSPAADWWRDWLDGAGVPARKEAQVTGLELDNQALEAGAALAGAGIAMLTPFLWRAELKAGRLIQPFDYVYQSPRSHWLVYPESRRAQAKVRAFRNWLSERVREAGAVECPQSFEE